MALKQITGCTKAEIRRRAKLHLKRTIGAIVKDWQKLKVVVKGYDTELAYWIVEIYFSYRRKKPELVGTMEFSYIGVIKTVSAPTGVQRRMDEVRGL